MHPIPYFPQKDEHTCGPAIVQMTLAAFDIENDQETLEKELEMSREADIGTDPNKITEVLRKYGLAVTEIHSASLSDITVAKAKSEIVIVCFTEPDWEWGHYAIVGEIEHSEIILIDPDPDHGPNFKMAIEEFERRWNDPLFTKTDHWMLAVSK